MHSDETHHRRKHRCRTRAELSDDIRCALRSDFCRSDREIAKVLGCDHTTVGRHRKDLESRGEILPRFKKHHSVQVCLCTVVLSAIRPSSWLNDQIYEPTREDDPAFLSFVADVRENGILEPIIVTRDGWILSGHRRYAAARYLGLEKVPVRIRPDVHSAMDEDQYLKLLASYNQHRVKTTTEVIREGVVQMDENAWQAVHIYRSEASAIGSVDQLTFRKRKARCQITQKLSLKKAIIDVVLANQSEWPLSDRKVFYLLLNVEGLLRNDVRKTPFENTPACYDDVTDMVTRLRLDHSIPFESIGDETRPVTMWDTHRSVNTFVEKELNCLFDGYFRDLMQSQPNHVELLVEKNTVASALHRVAAKYTIPMTSGRGYSSLPPRKAMVDRFHQSGREKLVVICVSDFDPEGEDIPQSFGRSLMDDFDLDEDQLVMVKAALTHRQTQILELHEGQLAKEDSSRYKRFVESYGERCWELEAIPNDALRELVEDMIRTMIDVEAFENELEQQLEEQQQLDVHRIRIKEHLADVDLNG